MSLKIPFMVIDTIRFNDSKAWTPYCFLIRPTFNSFSSHFYHTMYIQLRHT